MKRFGKRFAEDFGDEAGPPIVCVSDLIWDEHWSSEQQLMSRLSRRCRVLYVERPVSVLSFFTGQSDAPISRQFLRFFRGGLRYESETLAVLTIPPVLPLRFHWLSNRINEWIRRRAIRKAMRQLRVVKPVLWIYPPEAGRLVGTLGERASLYYCADDWAAFGQWWNRAADIRRLEGQLAAKVDLVIGTSTRLVAKWREKFRPVLLVSNGADVQAFKRARQLDVPVPPDLAAIPHPRVGYIGFVDDRFDTAMYEQMCLEHPEWNIVIIGPLQESNVDLRRLRAMGNVHILGPRRREDLPEYLRGMDVCTIPYIVNELSASIFPLKLFEYLAAGRPVAATALPELLPFTQYVRIARTAAEFIECVAMNLTDPLPQPPDAFLDANSWDTKADQLWERLRLMPSSPAGRDDR